MSLLSEQELDALTRKALLHGAGERGGQLNDEDDRLDAPLAWDCVRFALFLRNNTDYFSGPDLDVSFPEADDPQFYEVLAVNALIYTNEDGADELTIEPSTREQWIANNRTIAQIEGASPAEVFYNEIETRLALHEDLRNEADERLGAAYIACLAQYEARSDYGFAQTAHWGEWAPLTVAHLIEHEKITREEAEVLVKMAAEEYEQKVLDAEEGK